MGVAAGRMTFLGLSILLEFEAQVVPNNATLEVAARNRERHFIFARLQHRRVEPQRPLLPKSLVGVVANGVGGPDDS